MDDRLHQLVVVEHPPLAFSDLFVLKIIERCAGGAR